MLALPLLSFLLVVSVSLSICGQEKDKPTEFYDITYDPAAEQAMLSR